MELLGIETDLAKSLVHMERLDTARLTCAGGSRFFILQQQKALR
jgi:hypothetical protein